jgi:phage tail-like protein
VSLAAGPQPTVNPDAGQVTTRVAPDRVLPPAVDRILARLPEVYRIEDADLGHPLRRFVALIADQLTPIDDITDRGAGNADPEQVPPAWLPWLGQVCGVLVDARQPVAVQRARITDPARHRHGSAHAIAELVRPLLTGTQTVEVVPHWRGNPWLICIRTIETETPLTGSWISTWDELNGVLPTWDDLEELEWDAHVDRVRLQIIEAANPECPAGSRLCHAFIP